MPWRCDLLVTPTDHEQSDDLHRLTLCGRADWDYKRRFMWNWLTDSVFRSVVDSLPGICSLGNVTSSTKYWMTGILSTLFWVNRTSLVWDECRRWWKDTVDKERVCEETKELSFFCLFGVLLSMVWQ